MNKEELIDKMVTEVMEDFDFDRVHRVMVNLDWKWNIGDGEMTVPSSYRLTKKAESLLRDAAQHYGDKEFYSCGSGGFMAHLDGETLTLQFILTEMTSYASDFINIDEHDPCIDESNNLVKIKKGCNYLCLKSGTNLSTGRPSFIKGKIYQAPKDDVLVEEDGSLCDVSEGTDCLRLVE